ncbi:hypothetical protein [Paraburkholderia sp. J67]|uniref:hypothetical protein n=1 Tax=Paraburkholderia sp. J67 TaxID=2805435 RepID=UPI002ABE6C02|nr:hypothetical protein [Paraburkholderia sp. J67]
MNAVTMDSLPAISDARLPESYTNAVNALEQATAIDECQPWADKAMALASYARQSRDDRLHRMAMRIQARATRRCGELLHQFPPAAGRPPKVEINKAARTNISREQVAADVGMSKHHRVTALRVASVPKAEFERQVESTKPPTVTALADQGRKTPIEELCDGQLMEKYHELRAMGDGCYPHADEILRFIDARNAGRAAAGRA